MKDSERIKTKKKKETLLSVSNPKYMNARLMFCYSTKGVEAYKLKEVATIHGFNYNNLKMIARKEDWWGEQKKFLMGVQATLAKKRKKETLARTYKLQESVKKIVDVGMDGIIKAYSPNGKEEAEKVMTPGELDKMVNLERKLGGTADTTKDINITLTDKRIDDLSFEEIEEMERKIAKEEERGEILDVDSEEVF